MEGKFSINIAKQFYVNQYEKKKRIHDIYGKSTLQTDFHLVDGVSFDNIGITGNKTLFVYFQGD